jgi:hypothetical protein
MSLIIKKFKGHNHSEVALYNLDCTNFEPLLWIALIFAKQVTNLLFFLQRN